MEEKTNENVEKVGKKSKAWIAIAIIVILILVIVGCAGILVYNQIQENARIEEEKKLKVENELKIENVEQDCSEEEGGANEWRQQLLTGVVYKPIIYLYPEETTEVSVKLGKPENLTCTYPKYVDGWNVTAEPDGTLIDKDTGRSLYALYWEGLNTTRKEMTEGFVVKGEDSIKFLEEKLEILGLTEREAEEFIVYWLPKLEANEYNYIRFASMEEINEDMPLEIEPKPDTVIRVLMEFKGLDEPIEVQEQVLETPERNGFTVVEWGGTQIDG